MAVFDNVNYTFYSDKLGRAVIPTAEDFEKYKIFNVQTVKNLLPYIEEQEENGIDSAVCLMIEAEYKNEMLKSNADTSAISSESLGGHSVSYGSSKLTKQIELDAISLDQQKMDILKMFCKVCPGVR